MRFGASGSVVLVAFVSLNACHREKSPPPEATGRTPAVLGTGSLQKPSFTAPSASATKPRRTPEDEAAIETVRDWSDALDRHDLAKLGELYASTVRFYGSPRSKAAVIAAKRAALAKQPGFRQELIGDVTLERQADGAVHASFVKKAGPPEKWLVIGGKLVLTPNGRGYLVAEEADDETMKLDRRSPEGCEGVAAEVALGLPAAQKAIDEAQKEADATDGGASFGGFGPQADGDGGFSASMGLYRDDHFEPRFGYSVDKKGRLTVSAGGDDLTVSPDRLKAVEIACRR
ncbi:MAG TPA: hypothetical protein VF103_04215 [Polyangiaceae bacterium]